MFSSVSDRWLAMSSAARWTLYLPALILCIPLAFLPAILLLQMTNARIWGTWMSSAISGALLGFIAIQLAYRMAPAWKTASAATVTLPFSFFAFASIANYALGTPGSPGAEAVWGVAWFSSAVITARYLRKKSLSSS